MVEEEEERCCSTVPVSVYTDPPFYIHPLFLFSLFFCPKKNEKKKTRVIIPCSHNINLKTAGRDRTGVLAALLLALCRTPRALIAHDYLLTRIGVEPHRDFLFTSFFGTSAAKSEAKFEATRGVGKMGAEEKKKKEETKAGGLRELCEVRESSILAFLDWMDEEWGSACEGGRSVGGEEQHDEEEEKETASGVRGWLIDEMGFDDGNLDRIVERLRSE